MEQKDSEICGGRKGPSKVEHKLANKKFNARNFVSIPKCKQIVGYPTFTSKRMDNNNAMVTWNGNERESNQDTSDSLYSCKSYLRQNIKIAFAITDTSYNRSIKLLSLSSAKCD